MTNIFSKSKRYNFVSRFHGEVNLISMFFATIAFIAFVSFFKGIYSITESPVNIFISSIIFGGVFLHEFITSDILFSTLVTNYFELFGNAEKKDIIRLLDFLDYIKNDVLRKANPDRIIELYDSIEGRDTFTSVGILVDPNQQSPVNLFLSCIKNTSSFLFFNDGSAKTPEREQLLTTMEK